MTPASTMSKRRPQAKRRPLTRAELVARLPRIVRPQLTRDQKVDLALAHTVNLDIIATGEATEDLLWEFVGGCLTWSDVAHRLGVHAQQMAEQLAMADRMIERYRRTGRVAFSGPDYQLAKTGVMLMDELAAVVDQPTASIAADWAEARTQFVADGHATCTAQLHSRAASR